MAIKIKRLIIRENKLPINKTQTKIKFLALLILKVKDQTVLKKGNSMHSLRI